MGYFDQFKRFDPISGYVPNFPLPLRDIVNRARAILKGRTLDQITAAALTASWLMEQHRESEEERYEAERERYISRLVYEGGWELGLLREEDRNEAGIRSLMENWPSDADDTNPFPPYRDEILDFDALRACIGEYALEDDPEFPGGKEYEYFSVLALWLVVDAVDATNMKLQEQKRKSLLENVGQYTSAFGRDLLSVPPDKFEQLSIASHSAIEAVNAICWAEHLCYAQGKTEKIDSLNAMLAMATEKGAALEAIIEQTRSSVLDLAESKAGEKISLAARNAAIARHAENRAMKADVFAWCEENLGSKSIDAAAFEVAGKVVNISFRTAQKWISEYRKAVQSARTT